MELLQYQYAAQRTLAILSNKQEDSLHMLLGLTTEIGELADVYKRNLAYKKPIDLTNVKEEVGDILWYLVNFCTINEIDIEQVMGKNIAKLYARFPEKFTKNKALVRDIEAERKVLEG